MKKDVGHWNSCVSVTLALLIATGPVFLVAAEDAEVGETSFIGVGIDGVDFDVMSQGALSAFSPMPLSAGTLLSATSSLVRPLELDPAAVRLVGAAGGRAFALVEWGEPAWLATARPVAHMVGFSPDAKHLAYLGLEEGRPTLALTLENVENGEVGEPLPGTYVVHAQWAPSRPMLAATLATSNGFALALLDPVAGTVRLLVEGDVFPHYVRWDDTGEIVGYVSLRQPKAPAPVVGATCGPKSRVAFEPRAIDVGSGSPAAATTRFQAMLERDADRIAALGGGIIGNHGGNLLIRIGDSLMVANATGVVENVAVVVSSQAYTKPMVSAQVTQGGSWYAPPGNCNSGYSHYYAGMQYAYDLDNDGDPTPNVIAATGGTVVYKLESIANGTNGNSGWGNTVIVAHDDGSWGQYSHLAFGSVPDGVEVGRAVCQGQIIGVRGDTGNVSGSHLHHQKNNAAYVGAQSIPITFTDSGNPLSCAWFNSGSAEIGSCAPGASGSRNLLQNASFEIGSLAPWSKWNNPAVNWAIYADRSRAHEGLRFLEANSSVGGGSIFQDVAIVPQQGESYTFSVWMRAPEAPVAVTVALWALDGTQEAGSTETVIGNAWTLVSAPLDVAGGGHSKLRAEVYIGTIGVNLDLDGATLVSGNARWLWRPAEVSGGVSSPLRVRKGASADTVVLEFADVPGAAGYHLYEGSLPIAGGYSHGTGAVCDVETVRDGDRRSTPASGLGSPGSHYYLVTAFASAEGPAGFDSSGQEIPMSLNVCLP